MKNIIITIIFFGCISAQGQLLKKMGSNGQTHNMYGIWQYNTHPTTLSDKEIVDWKTLKDSTSAIRTSLGVSTNITAKRGLTRIGDSLYLGMAGISDSITLEWNPLIRKNWRVKYADTTFLGGINNYVDLNWYIKGPSTQILNFTNNANNNVYQMLSNSATGEMRVTNFNGGFYTTYYNGATEYTRFNGFGEWQFGSTTRIGTSNRIQITGKSYFNGSVKIDKDSIPIAANTDGLYVLLLDSTATVDSNKVKRILPSALTASASLTSTYIGVGAAGVLGGSSAFTYDGTTVKQENATAATSITSTTSLGSGSGGDIRLFAKATPTGADQRLGGVMYGTLDGGTTENTTASMEAFSTAAHTPGSSEQTHLRFYTSAVATKTEVMRITANLRVGIGTTTIPSTLTLGAGNASVNPFAFTTGTRMTTPTNGSWAFESGVLLFAPSGNTYKRPALVNDVAPSNGQIPIGNGTDFTAATLTGSSSVGVANASGSITLTVPTSFASSATYSPSTTLTTNAASATVNAASYSRQGSIITFSLDITVDPTSIGLVEVGIAFPSGIDNIVNTYDVRGTANTNDVDLENGTVRADVGNQRMILRFTATNIGARTYSVSGQYTYSAP
jgi:hypothetical protein